MTLQINQNLQSFMRFRPLTFIERNFTQNILRYYHLMMKAIEFSDTHNSYGHIP